MLKGEALAIVEDFQQKYATYLSYVQCRVPNWTVEGRNKAAEEYMQVKEKLIEKLMEYRPWKEAFTHEGI